MKVLSFILASPYGVRPFPNECNLALKEMVDNIIVTLYPEDGLVIIPNVLINEIQALKPDIFFSVNYFDCVGRLSKILKIPYASWIGDNPHYYLKKDEESSYLFIFLWEKSYIHEIKAKGFKNVYYLPSATNPERFKRLELKEEDLARYGCDLSFVGSSLYHHYEAYERFKEGKSKELQEILSKAIEIQIQNPTLNIEDILYAIQEATGTTIVIKEDDTLALNTLLQLSSMARYRFEYIKEVSPLGLHLWGDDGWLGWKDYGLNFKGGIAYNDLPKLYNASKINLNITVAQARSSLNQRPFDVSACGAFILTDYRSELSSLFKLGEEMVCYRDKEELKELISFYLSHPDERIRIATRARERVLKEHTFKDRIRKILDIILTNR